MYHPVDASPVYFYTLVFRKEKKRKKEKKKKSKKNTAWGRHQIVTIRVFPKQDAKSQVFVPLEHYKLGRNFMLSSFTHGSSQSPAPTSVFT